MGKDVIIACDFASSEEIFNFLDKFNPVKPFIKIGMELFYAEGPSIVKKIKERGHKIFLDLKLHDIPTTVKKAMKAVELTDEAVLSGYGNPVGETNNQLAKAIAAKVDTDALEALNGAQLIYDGSANKIAYAGIIDAIDVFNEEVNSEKVIFVHPKQVTALRKDTDFISADKYPGHTMVTGEIGKIANCRVVASRKVKDDGTLYHCPIVKLNNDAESEGDAAALTIYIKRETNVETDRISLARKTDISADKLYVAVLTNTSKVVLAKFKK